MCADFKQQKVVLFLEYVEVLRAKGVGRAA
jgi:hypothetical protein